MDLLIVKAALIFHFLLRQRVDSSLPSFSKYQISSKENDTENILKDFINRFKTAYLEKYVPRHVATVGASAEDLRQFESLFESYPYLVCTEPETCVYLSCFSPGSFVIIFLEDLRDETFRKNVNILSRCRDCKVLYIFRGIIEKKRIGLLFTSSMQKYGVNARLAHLDKNVTRFYGNFVGKNCSIEVRLIFTWTPGAALDVTDTWTSGVRDLNGCLVAVSTLNFLPKMTVEEHENGSLIITGGLEGMLILALARKLNFTVEPIYPPILDRIKYSRKSAILREVANENTEIGIGRLRPTNDINDSTAYSVAYDHDCVTWGVPQVMIYAEDVITMEFTWQVWALVGLVFAITCIIGSACHNIDSLVNGNRKNMGIVVVVLDIVAIHLGSPVVNVPTSVSGKFMLMMSLQYTLVVTTAYKTSLASILATENGWSAIVDSEGIIGANLGVGGASYNLDFLKDQANDNETISKLIERFEVINDPTEVIRRLKFDEKFAVISRRSAMNYERYKIFTENKKRTSMPFNILGDCVLYHETVMVFRKESYLREPVDDVIRRLTESGILGHWDIDKFGPEEMTKHKSKSEKYFESSTSNKFKNIFVLYLICITLCLITFFIEIGVSMYGLRKRKHAGGFVR